MFGRGVLRDGPCPGCQWGNLDGVVPSPSWIQQDNVFVRGACHAGSIRRSKCSHNRGRGAIGWATAQRLALEGASVTIWDVDDKLIAEAQTEIQRTNYQIRLEQVDLLDAHAIDQGIAEMIEKEGRIDVLVNNVGGSLHTPQRFLELTDQHWRQVLDLNVMTAVRVSRSIIPHMVERGYGRIVNLGSKAGRFGSLFTGANYAAAKGAIQAMTVQIAHEFGPMGITCNAVCPGVILAERVDRLLASRQTPQQRRQIIETITVRRQDRKSTRLNSSH